MSFVGNWYLGSVVEFPHTWIKTNVCMNRATWMSVLPGCPNALDPEEWNISFACFMQIGLLICGLEICGLDPVWVWMSSLYLLEQLEVSSSHMRTEAFWGTRRLCMSFLHLRRPAGVSEKYFWFLLNWKCISKGSGRPSEAWKGRASLWLWL